MEKKELGQVFTPIHIVQHMLNKVGYVSSDSSILHKRIIEPSFGRGIFLFEIVDRIIQAGVTANLDKETISNLLSDNIWGIEYDTDLHMDTLTKLDNYVQEKGYYVSSWNLFNQDALKFSQPESFDFVVGNPPYIRVHDMDSQLRESVKNFSMSLGTTDLYVIFFEHGISLLNETGKLAYITPNSFLRNTSQGTFRKHLLSENLITRIDDFGSKIIFPDAATYTAITFLDKNKVDDSFTYHSENETEEFLLQLHVKDFTDNEGNYSKAPWSFTDAANYGFIKEIESRPIKVENISHIQNGILTLRNKLFINPMTDVEEGLLRPVVKASAYKGQTVTDKIIFPYHMDAVTSICTPMNEEWIKENFPVGYAHLLSNKEELLTRDLDKNAAWHQYGRSQGLNNMYRRKLVMNHVLSSKAKTLKVHELAADVIVYSGLFITEKEGGMKLEEIKELLESEEFCKYVLLCGKNKSGGFKEISTKTIKEYGIPIS
jgi:adenine-specific DNA-methyltransferase